MRRTRSRSWSVGLGLTLAACSAGVPADGQGPIPGEARRQELVHLLRQDCGACHGLRLAGGLGPALLPEDLRGKPAESLSEVILKGRPGTPMPGWQPFVTEAEARWMVDMLMNGLTEELKDKR
jgi:cytochrome c55X